MILKDHLYTLGYSVVGEAKTTEDSLDKYEKLKPDITIVDADIPDNDGISAVIQLIRRDPTADIIVVVGRGQTTLALEALTAGAKDFITKPINPRQLHRTIQLLGRPSSM